MARARSGRGSRNPASDSPRSVAAGEAVGARTRFVTCSMRFHGARLPIMARDQALGRRPSTRAVGRHSSARDLPRPPSAPNCHSFSMPSALILQWDRTAHLSLPGGLDGRPSGAPDHRAGQTPRRYKNFTRPRTATGSFAPIVYLARGAASSTERLMQPADDIFTTFARSYEAIREFGDEPVGLPGRVPTRSDDVRHRHRAPAGGDRRAGDGGHREGRPARPHLHEPHHPRSIRRSTSSTAWRRRSSGSSASCATPPRASRSASR